MRSICVSVCALVATLAPASVLELNPAGSFSLDGTSDSGALVSITNLGVRELDQAFLDRVAAALQYGYNGVTSDLTPVAHDLGVTVTLDGLTVGGSDTPDYPGGGWFHEVRYNGVDLSEWRTVWMYGRTYAPDAQFGFADLSYESLDIDGVPEEVYPFYRAEEDRDGSTIFGDYAIHDGIETTWFTINGSSLEMENTFLLARVVGGTLEIGTAWGFHETVTVVPAPASLLGIGGGLLAARRRRR